MSLTLQIPRSDRRLRPRRKPAKIKTGVVIASLSIVAATAAAVLAVFLPETALRDAQNAFRYYTTQALVVSGFGIDQVSVSGQRYTLDSDVFDALDLTNIKTFAALDTAAALKRIERISWVDSAQISRVYPGNLNVRIRERLPTAIWTRADTDYLIDATGRTLGPVHKNNSWALPRITGEGANTDAPVLLAALGRHKGIQNQFDHAERIAERRWSVVLKNGSRIELAADREVEGLDQVAASTVLKRALMDQPSIVDVRTSGRAVTRPLVGKSAAATLPATVHSQQLSATEQP
jgi:cell division protein FtsQ